MAYCFLLHHLIEHSATQHGTRPALLNMAGQACSYQTLSKRLEIFAQHLLQIALPKQARVAVLMDKSFECIVAAFGTSLAGGIFVPINPVLKPEQIAHILEDSGAYALVISATRARQLFPNLPPSGPLKHIILTDTPTEPLPDFDGQIQAWPQTPAAHMLPTPVLHSHDLCAIFYTSGSTGRPKGVMLSHQNIVTGAHSVASYLGNVPEDRLLAALPLSFDAGFSQLTTAFSVGASVVLLNYLLPADVIKAVATQHVTGLTAVPPLWIQLAQRPWPEAAQQSLRYFANTGGHMPRPTLQALRTQLPHSTPFLMYGLTEAFRASYLPPSEIDARPDSMGKAIPNTEILVLRPDGSLCDAHEPGELVQCGPLVAQGYWNNPAQTAERFKPLPAGIRPYARHWPEIAVFSGDTVKKDEDGFLYFIGRADDMIKTSGYRVSPTEIEEQLYGSGLLVEAIAFGVPDATLGQTITVVEYSHPPVDAAQLLTYCRAKLPSYMVPTRIIHSDTPLPRNANGKIDRKQLATEIRQPLS